MAKRLSDTEKWMDGWFRRLPTNGKILWLYILDRCDISGVWEIDLDLFNLLTGSSATVEEMERDFGDRLHFFDGRRKVWIRRFIDFQNGPLDPESKSPIIKSILKSLKNHGLWEPYFKGINTLSYRDKEKERVKEREKEEEKARTPEQKNEPFQTFLPVIHRLFGKPTTHLGEMALAKLIPQLSEAGATVKDLEDRVAHYRRCWPDHACTLKSILTHWDTIPTLKHKPEQKKTAEVGQNVEWAV